MPREKDPDSGEFTETVTKDDLSSFADSYDEKPVFTVGDVTDELDIGQSQANAKLNELVEDGALDRATVGSRAVIYWLSGQQ